MKKILLLLVLLMSGVVFSQEKTVNDYKYLIVPEKFEWLREPNEYNLNALTKMVFEKYGFSVFYSGQKLPDDLALDKCKALYANVANESGLMATTLVITLDDCNGKRLFTSMEGKSKQKSYQKAYYEALREASASVASMNYKYNGNADNIVEQAAKLKIVETAPATTAPATVAPVVNENQLFAQPVANGYQLVDTTPKVVLRMYKTSQPDSYTAQGEGKNGVVFKKGNEWFFEYYQNDKLVSEKLNIKF